MVDVGYIGRGVPPAASANVCAMNDPRRDRDPLQLLFDTLDQAGPGSEQSTLAALARLPPEDWTEHYYQPLADRIAKLRDLAAEWPDLAAIIEETEEEMDLYHRHGDSFGYVFFLLEKAG